MQRTVETLAAKKILEGDIEEGDTITIDFDGEALTVL
jgi:ATP-dependent Clp protease ATP-binding subunit ClpA